MTPLRAGPLTLGFLEGDLRKVRLGGLEVARRIYFALRDRNWRTIPGRIENLRLQERGSAFEITYRSVHLAPQIDFRWEARIRGDEPGVIRFEAQGRAYTDFLRNRIGLCVHHPLRECAGLTVRINGREGQFPRLVSPHQPLTGFQRLRYTLLPGLDVEFRFEGETFETEDHRNWGDANYKTYGTPLALPFPVLVRRGSELRQAVTLRLEGHVPKHLPERHETGLVLPSAWRPLPPIGFCYSPGRIPVELQPSHLRLDIGASDTLPRLPVPLELAVHLEAGQESQQLQALSARAGEIARLLVFHRNEKVTSARWMEIARRFIPGVTVVGGTNMWFAELNRDRPQLPAWPVAFALSPQVHASDEISMVENLEAFPQMLATAKDFLRGAPVHVTPVTLKPRFNPVATEPDASFDNTDPRQGSDFAAAWTLGALSALLEEHPASLTFYEINGPRGLEHRGTRYPVYYLFAFLGLYANGEFAPAGGPGAIWLRRQRRQAFLLANLSESEAEVDLPPVAGRLEQSELIGRDARLALGSGRVRLPAWAILACQWEV